MSRQMPYQPMGSRTPPAGDEQVAKMFKKLHANARSDVSVSIGPETQSPQAKPASPLSWNEPVWTLKPTHGYILSTDERYMIDKAESTYNAYRRGTLRQHAGKYLGFANDVEGAKALCKADAQV